MTQTISEAIIIDQALPFGGNLLDVRLDGTSKVRIQYDGDVIIEGKVGVGVTTPTHSLGINGSLRSIGAPGSLGILLNAQDAVGIRYLDKVARIRAENGGLPTTLFIEGYDVSIGPTKKLGVGTTSPTYPLDVLTLGAGDVTAYHLRTVQQPTSGNGVNILFSAHRLPNTSTALAKISGVMTDHNDATYKGVLVFATANTAAPTERVRINHLGNVGIGTAAPAVRLDVAGDAQASGFVGGNELRTAGVARVDGSGNLVNIANLTLSGNITVGGTVDGVDVSGHVANINAHHNESHGDPTHTVQYAILAGRAGGQLLNGGTGAVESLRLQSTSHATKGSIYFNDGFGTGQKGVTIEDTGNVKTNGNLWVLRKNGIVDPNDVIITYIGEDESTCIYTFFQKRDAANGGYWAGINTYKGNAQPAWGYGFYPWRNWGKNSLIESNGNMVARSYYSPIMYFQKPWHRNVSNGNFNYPDHYTNDISYLTPGNTVELGGISWNAADQGVYVQRTGNGSGSDLEFRDLNNTSGILLRQLVRGWTDRVRVQAGEGSTDGNGNASGPSRGSQAAQCSLSPPRIPMLIIT